jgi:hypothetical protein
LGAIDGEGVGDFEGSSVVGAAVVGVALGLELVEGCSVGADEILGEEVGLVVNVGGFVTVGTVDGAWLTVGLGEVVGSEETVGLTLGIFVTVGYIVGDPVGCIPGKHSLLASLLFLKSQQAAIAHIDLLSSYS